MGPVAAVTSEMWPGIGRRGFSARGRQNLADLVGHLGIVADVALEDGGVRVHRQFAPDISVATEAVGAGSAVKPQEVGRSAGAGDNELHREQGAADRR